MMYYDALPDSVPAPAGAIIKEACTLPLPHPAER